MSSMEDVVTNRYVAVKHYMKNGVPEEPDFELKTEPFPLSNEPGEKDVIVKTLYLSIDPYMFNRMKNKSSSFQPIKFSGAILPGKAIDGMGVGRVVVSGDPSFKEGDLVTGLLSWGDYTRIKQGTALNKLDTMGLPLSYYSGGILGSSGLTAHAGFFELCKPKKGEKVFVSAASGSVGNLVGQYAKLVGCYVVGCAGSKEKVKLLKEKLGFDEAFNYKEETDLNSALKRYFPDGIDIYFDNVGGEMLEAAIENMNAFGRVAACGVISEYTDENKRAAPNMLDVIYKRITIRGFLCTDHINAYNDFVSATVGYLREGKMQVIEDISDGLESLPSAFVSLFRGGNVGKKTVRVSDD